MATGTYEQKTLLIPRSAGRGALFDQDLSRTHRHATGLRKKGHVTATAFFGESLNKSELGQYFGVGTGKNSFRIGASGPVAAPLATTDLDGGFLVHDNLHPEASTLGGIVTFNPKQTVVGAKLAYRQAFSGPFDKMFVEVGAPFVQVKNTMGMSVAQGTNGLGGFSVEDFFAGKVQVNGGADAQDALTNGKIVKENTVNGVADLDVTLGYEMVNSEDTHVDLYAKSVIPTGNKSKAEFLWEPLVGNNDHFGLGVGVDGDITLWRDPRGRLMMHGDVNYAYFFENTEKRMAGITRRTEGAVKFNQYALVGKIGDQKLAPAANVLAQDYRVRPGSQVEATTGLSFHSDHVYVNVGYNMNWKEEESVYRKGSDADPRIITKDKDLAAAITFGPPPPGTADNRVPGGGAVSYIDAVRQESNILHTFGGALGYTFGVKDQPVMLGFGAQYEMPHSTNAGVEAYKVWLKMGISF